MLVDTSTREVGLGLLHRGLVGCQRHGGTAFRIRDQQGERLRDAVAPLSDIAALQAAVGLVVLLSFLHQLALAAHRVLGILICVIEVRCVQADCYHRGDGDGGGGFQQMAGFALTKALNGECSEHQQLWYQEVIRHLHMVAVNLKRGKKGGDNEAPQVFAFEAHHHSGYRRRDISQGDGLPEVAGGDDDEEIAGERPNDGTERSHPAAEVERAEQDVEAQHRHEHIPHVVGQAQMVNLFNKRHRLR